MENSFRIYNKRSFRFLKKTFLEILVEIRHFELLSTWINIRETGDSSGLEKLIKENDMWLYLSYAIVDWIF